MGPPLDIVIARRDNDKLTERAAFAVARAGVIESLGSTSPRGEVIRSGDGAEGMRVVRAFFCEGEGRSFERRVGRWEN